MRPSIPDDYDEEEHRAPPSPPSATSQAAPTARAPGEHSPLAGTPLAGWGLVGSHHSAGPLTTVRGTGVTRLVEGGVKYQQPPLAHHWYAVSSRPQHYEMPWSGDVHKVSTLGQLGQQLRQDRGPLTEADPRLHRLDNLARRLLGLVSDLHQNGWRIGLLHPENILLAEEDGGAEPVLVDLGFVWEEGAPPDWIKKNPYAPLWAPDDPNQRQRAGPRKDQLPVAADLRLLAHLFACVLTGDRTFVPPRPAAPVWQTLQTAHEGGLTAAAEFAYALDQTPLSGHFLPFRAPVTPPRGSGVLLASLLAAGLLAAGAITLSIWQPWKARTSPNGPMVLGPGNGKANDSGPENKKKEKDRKEVSGAEERRQMESAEAWKRYREDWLQRYRNLLQQVKPNDPAWDVHRFALGRQFQELHDQLIAARRQVPPEIATLSPEEEQCLKHSAAQAKELGLQ